MSRHLIAFLLACIPVLATAQSDTPPASTKIEQVSISTVPRGSDIGPPETSPVLPASPAPVETIVEPPAPPETVDPAVTPEATVVTEPPPAAANPIPEAIPATAENRTDGKLDGNAVFQRLSARLSQPVCPDGDAVQRLRKRYAGQPAAFARHLADILPLLEFVTGEIERSGLPAEFAFIPIVESWYRPDAMGIGGPAGMWQMIASTARNHGVHIKPGYDGRLSPVESTRAALSYLKVLYGMFGGDWQAAVMAYNAGEYRLLKALRVQGDRGVSAQQRRPHGLSAITYDYVSKLQALSCLIAEPERSGLALPRETTFTPLAPVLVAAGTRSLEQVAQDTGISASLLRQLNPGYRGGRIASGVPRMVLMPGLPTAMTTVADQSEAASTQATDAAKPDHDDSTALAATAGVHEVRNGETLWSIAKRYGLSLDQLRKLNRLGRGSLIRIGQSLRVQP